MRRGRALAASAAFLLSGFSALRGGPPEAFAKASFESPYTLTQTYNAALRLLRVDLGLTITERDPAVAYILFDYKSPETAQRTVAGSIEMLDAGRTVKVIVQLGQMPRYHEQVISDALGKKLRSDYGDPTPRRPEPSPDAGAGSPPDTAP
jgi:hypothetical protein